MKIIILTIIFIISLFGNNEEVLKNEIKTPLENEINQKLFIEEKKVMERIRFHSPLMERHILTDIKEVREKVNLIRVETSNKFNEVNNKINDSKIDVVDKALSYVTSTVNNIFIILTLVVSLLAFIGWNTLTSIKKSIKNSVKKDIENMIKIYEEKLKSFEIELKSKSETILENQVRITNAEEVASLWRRSHLEDNLESKISLYNEILKINVGSVEAMAYKADVLLEQGQKEHALELCGKAIDIDKEYAYAYWQRACAYSEMGNFNLAIEDLKFAVKKLPSLIKDIETEKSFKEMLKNSEWAEKLKDLLK